MSKTILVLVLTVFSFVAHANGIAPPKVSTTKENPDSQSAPKRSLKFLEFFKNRKWDFIPVPVYENRPDSGQSFGALPVALMADQDEVIKGIFGVMLQYNTYKKFDPAIIAYLYPEPEQEIEFYAEVAQETYREFSAHFFDPHLGEKLYLDTTLLYLNSQFGFFFGLGPDTAEAARSDYVLRALNGTVDAGYYLLQNFRINLTETVHSTEIRTGVIGKFPDTLAAFAGHPNISDSTNLIHKISAVYDSRPDREYSEKGTYVGAGYFFSSDKLGSDATFHGFQLEAMQLIPTIRDRSITALRLNVQEVFGDNVPFNELSSLGGAMEMRGFVPGRFVDHGKIALQAEERIKLFHWKLFGKEFDIHADPYFELGRVFSKTNKLDFTDWQPIGGLGFRLFVPPNVVGRVDLSVGSDGFEIYTALGYPF